MFAHIGVGEPRGASVVAEDAEGKVNAGVRASHARGEADLAKDGCGDIDQVRGQPVERRGPVREGTEGRRRDRPVDLTPSQEMAVISASTHTWCRIVKSPDRARVATFSLNSSAQKPQDPEETPLRRGKDHPHHHTAPCLWCLSTEERRDALPFCMAFCLFFKYRASVRNFGL